MTYRSFFMSSVLAAGLSLGAALPANTMLPGNATLSVAAASETTYQESSGLTWGVASMEFSLISSVLTLAATGDDEVSTALALGLISVATGVTSGVTQAVDAPVEPALVFHHGLQGGLLLGGALFFGLAAAGADSDPTLIATVATMIAGAGGGATYALLRMQSLSHDPRLIEEAHLMSWGPIATFGLTSMLFSAVGLSSAGLLVGSILGLGVYGLAIGMTESTLSEDPGPPAVLGDFVFYLPLTFPFDV